MLQALNDDCNLLLIFDIDTLVNIFEGSFAKMGAQLINASNFNISVLLQWSLSYLNVGFFHIFEIKVKAQRRGISASAAVPCSVLLSCP